MTAEYLFVAIMSGFVWVPVGLFLAGMGKVAKRSDEDSEYLGEQVARGDVRL